jgi:hypothetical protein
VSKHSKSTCGAHGTQRSVKNKEKGASDAASFNVFEEIIKKKQRKKRTHTLLAH